MHLLKDKASKPLLGGVEGMILFLSTLTKDANPQEKTTLH